MHLLALRWRGLILDRGFSGGTGRAVNITGCMAPVIPRIAGWYSGSGLEGLLGNTEPAASAGSISGAVLAYKVGRHTAIMTVQSEEAVHDSVSASALRPTISTGPSTGSSVGSAFLPSSTTFITETSWLEQGGEVKPVTGYFQAGHLLHAYTLLHPYALLYSSTGSNTAGSL